MNEYQEQRENWRRVRSPEQMKRSITRIAHEILERNGGAEKIAIVGIRTRGEHLAKRISQKVVEIEGVEVPFGVVDITLYRDDVGENAEQPLVRGSEFPFNVDAYTIVLVDDVLFTGRTVRAALDAIIDFGRPVMVQLAVLADRGHRELPIRPDFVGKNIPTAKHEMVEVLLTECDGEDGVFIRDKKSTRGGTS